jgi:radical SAM protein with 4Fe4S-binding SPASM domain
MLNRDDWVELELTKQRHRLKYIDAVLKGKTYCDFPPRRIFIEPTNACNLKCIHCVRDGKMSRALGYIDLGLFEKILEDIKDWNRLSEICLFQQGEPLLHKQIAEMARLCSTQYDFFTKMNTNGLALNCELSEELIRNRLDYLVFSLDAITPETYKRIKRRDCFERVINNILDYLEIWGDLDTGYVRNYFPCDINMLEEKANKHEIPLSKEMLERLPIGHISVYELHNFMGAVEEANQKLDRRSELPKEKWPCCNSPWDVLGIRWNGEAVACIYDYDSRYVVGNVKEHSVWEIWNSDAMMEFRKALLDRNYERIERNGPLCSECTIMWMEDYHLPTDFYREIERMQQYLDRAIDRVARRWERTDELLEKHKYLKKNREAWMDELLEKGKELSLRGKVNG